MKKRQDRTKERLGRTATTSTNAAAERKLRNGDGLDHRLRLVLKAVLLLDTGFG